MVSAPGPAQRWVRLRPRSTACGLPLRPTRTRPARLWIATIWHDSSVAGPAPALVRSVWGLLAPASSDSDTTNPAPEQPRSGMIAQSWVQLRPWSAAVLVRSISVRLGLGQPGSGKPRSGLIAQSRVQLRPWSAACGACWLPLRPTRIRLARLRISHVLA